jgi:hypothetical protein
MVRRILGHRGKCSHAFPKFVPIEWGSGVTISWERIFDMGQTIAVMSHREEWSGMRESNPRLDLGKVAYYHYTNPAKMNSHL